MLPFTRRILRHLRRRPPLYYILLTLTLLYLTHTFSPLISLLAYQPTYTLLPSTLLAKDASWRTEEERIPRIIHQTWKNDDIPEKWAWSQGFTKNMTRLKGEEWTYMFWTDASALSFISTHYPSYLSLYSSYRYPIQRADALRYFLLHHYGGVYLNMDIAPYRRLDALLTLPAFACETTPTGISNDALGSVEGHSFYGFVIENLEGYNRDWGSPYVTVMASTGPLFLSLVLQKYEEFRSTPFTSRPWSDGAEPAAYREGEGGAADTEMGSVVVLETEEGVTGHNFFWNVEGRSWQGGDEKVVEWFERHWCVSIVLAIGAVVVVWEGVWSLLCWGGRGVRRGVRGMGSVGRR